jgi:hypothetical protein
LRLLGHTSLVVLSGVVMCDSCFSRRFHLSFVKGFPFRLDQESGREPPLNRAGRRAQPRRQPHLPTFDIDIAIMDISHPRFVELNSCCRPQHVSLTSHKQYLLFLDLPENVDYVFDGLCPRHFLNGSSSHTRSTVCGGACDGTCSIAIDGSSPMT